MFRQYAISQLAGTAAGTATSSVPINGLLQAVYVSLNTSGTLTLATASSPAITLFSVPVAGTQWYYPRVNVHGGTAGTLAYGDGYAVCEPPAIPGDYVKASLDAGGTVNVTLLVKQ